MHGLQALPVVVDADFDEGLPEEEADQDMAAPPESDSANLDTSLTADLASSSQQEATMSSQVGDAIDKAAAAAARLCSVCGQKADAKWLICSCGARSHIECLAKRFLQVRTQLP